MGKNQYLEPIDTMYKNYRFRSRLEAKWAVFFERMGWVWRYEEQGYKLPSGPYLPDFYFPDIDVYAEVKPYEFSKEELNKCKELSLMKSKGNVAHDIDVLLLVGQPEHKIYEYIIGGNVEGDFIFVPSWEKYYPFFVLPSESDLDYFEETKKCARYAKAARFEFEWREK